jgi:hypothetical protein
MTRALDPRERFGVRNTVLRSPVFREPDSFKTLVRGFSAAAKEISKLASKNEQERIVAMVTITKELDGSNRAEAMKKVSSMIGSA